MNYLAPSILAADFSKLGEQIRAVVQAGADMIHLDVMDGSFVPNISFGVPVIQTIRKVTDVTFDVHLMIHDPIRYIADFVKAGADMITVHYEACMDVAATLEAVREAGVKVGLAISPNTPANVVESYVEQLDMVLIMSVYPGFGGQTFMEDSIDKIKAVKAIAEGKGREDMWIEVDGGIDFSNLCRIKDAGVNVFVAGSTVFKGDIADNVRGLKALM